VAQRPRFKLTAAVLDAPGRARAGGLLPSPPGMDRRAGRARLGKARRARGRRGLSFQSESNYVRPTWPAGPGDQQMMIHLDIEVDDLEAAVAVGARLAEYQPQDDVRVHLDPAGHPFCLWVPT
jgi:hypothetical protein